MCTWLVNAVLGKNSVVKGKRTNLVRLVALATKRCAVALNICNTVIAAFFLHTEMYIS
jgi:hypothetical protein